MQEGAELELYDFMYGKFLLKDLFDIDIHRDDYVERAYTIYKRIGNVATVLHSFEATIDSTLQVQIPCNAYGIDAVTTKEEFDSLSFEDNTLFAYDPTSGSVTENTLLRGFMTTTKPTFYGQSRQHASGSFVPYEIDGDCLNFDEKFEGVTVIILYKGLLVDQDNNPCLNSKEAEAIAYRMAFLDTQKKVFMQDPAASQLLAYIKPESEIKMQAAAIPERLSQNFFDRLLDIKTSHNRKVYNNSYKSIK